MVVNNDDLWVTGRSLVLFAPTLSSFQTVRLHKGTTRRGKNELVLKNVVNVIHRSGEIWLCQMVKTSPLKHRRQVKRKSNQNWLSNTLLSLAELGCPHSLSYYPACQSSSIWCADERKRKKALPGFICRSRPECCLIKVNAVWRRSAVITFTAQRGSVWPRVDLVIIFIGALCNI